jgi:mRNA interferase HicA
MNRVDLIKAIEGFGCLLVRRGGKHDWYRNPATGVSQPVPRHREIKEGLARHIIKMLANPAEGNSGPQSPQRSPP